MTTHLMPSAGNAADTVPDDIVHPAETGDAAPYIPAGPTSMSLHATNATEALRNILSGGQPVDDESTLEAAWLYYQITNNLNITALLGTNDLGIPNVFRYSAEPSAVPPYIVFNLIGGPGDSLTADHRRVLFEGLWYVNLITNGGDDTIIGPILRQLVLTLSKQGGPFLSGMIIDCWRNQVINPTVEVSKDQVFVSNVSEYSIQATIPDA